MATPGWICYKPGQDMSVFLQRHKPSDTTDRFIFWIYVPNPQRPDIEEELDERYIEKMFDQVTKSGDVTPEDIKTIATLSKYTSGKWLIFRKPDLIDEVWNLVAQAVLDNKLGTAAKVSSRSSAMGQRGQEHVICVYTRDFTDQEDVMRVEHKLRQLGITGKLTYKPDIYTTLGIYFKNPWNLKPTVYETDS